jgi:hypothetical protein
MRPPLSLPHREKPRKLGVTGIPPECFRRSNHRDTAAAIDGLTIDDVRWHVKPNSARNSFLAGSRIGANRGGVSERPGCADFFKAAGGQAAPGPGTDGGWAGYAADDKAQIHRRSSCPRVYHIGAPRKRGSLKSTACGSIKPHPFRPVIEATRGTIAFSGIPAIVEWSDLAAVQAPDDWLRE